MSEQTFVSVGRRKTATARVRLTRGTGKFEINGKDAASYFKTEEFTNAALSPLKERALTAAIEQDAEQRQALLRARVLLREHFGI